MIPALQIRTLRVGDFSRKEAAAARTEERELVSRSRSSTRLGSRKELQAALPFSMERTARKTRAPVAAIARPVSMPIPEEQPVMRKT
jgi:hypothetical protein